MNIKYGRRWARTGEVWHMVPDTSRDDGWLSRTPALCGRTASRNEPWGTLVYWGPGLRVCKVCQNRRKLQKGDR